MRKLFILVPSCGYVSGDKFMSSNITLSWVPICRHLKFHFDKTKAFQGVHLLPQQGFEISQVFVQGGSRPVWLNKSSPAAVNGSFSLPSFRRSRGQGYTFIFFAGAGFPCPSSPVPVCWPAGLLVAGGWGAGFAFLSRICLSDQSSWCTLQKPSKAGSLAVVLGSLF